MEKQKVIFIVGITAVVMIIAGAILYFVVPKPLSKQPVGGTIYHDPASGESTAENSQLRQSNQDSNLPGQPTYLGFSKLIDYGLSNTQLVQVKSAIYNYSQKQSKKITEVSLVVASVRQPDTAPGSGVSSYEFDIKANRSDSYFVRIEFTDTSSCTVTIYTADKKTLLFTQ